MRELNEMEKTILDGARSVRKAAAAPSLRPRSRAGRRGFRVHDPVHVDLLGATRGSTTQGGVRKGAPSSSLRPPFPQFPQP